MQVKFYKNNNFRNTLFLQNVFIFYSSNYKVSFLITHCKQYLDRIIYDFSYLKSVWKLHLINKYQIFIYI